MAEAAERTQEEETAKVALTTTIDGGQAQSVSLEGSGTLDFANQRGQLNFDLSGVPGAQRQGMSEMTTIFDGPTVYLRVPLPGLSKPWIRIDADQMAAAGGMTGQLDDERPDPGHDRPGQGASGRMDLSRADLPQGQGAPPVVDVLMELYDFATQVAVTPPPADQVTDIARLQSQPAP